MPRRTQQLSFLPPPRREHGGSKTSCGRRKLARPFVPKLPLHVILKSERARGASSFLKPAHRRWIEIMLARTAEKHSVRIHRSANGGNHLHLLLQTRRREQLRAFLRELSGRIAMRMTGARKGQARGRFFEGLPWSRLVEWGRDFAGVTDYLVLNALESLGVGRREQGLSTRSVVRAPPRA